MHYLLICAIAFLASSIALLSGFGLSTLLVPVFALFFPIPLAIGAVALIHFLNNLFQIALVGKYASKSVVLKFGIPAALSAAIGAYFLSFLSKLPPLFTHRYDGISMTLTLIGLIVGIIVVCAALFELIPGLSQLSVPSKYIPLGGTLSGFFGGLTGNQGTLRAAFLIKANLTKEQYIGTSTFCSLLVDIVRLFVYSFALFYHQLSQLSGSKSLLIAATLSAFLGSYLGSKLIPKISFKALHVFVGILLLFLGILIMLGASP